ncbi:MAG: hypothetical protein AAF735_05780 [Myxococcota bacterium]
MARKKLDAHVAVIGTVPKGCERVRVTGRFNRRGRFEVFDYGCL